MKYRIYQFARGSYHIVDENNIPIYDNAPYGKDKPVIWHDYDNAVEYLDRLNNESDSNE